MIHNSRSTMPDDEFNKGEDQKVVGDNSKAPDLGMESDAPKNKDGNTLSSVTKPETQNPEEEIKTNKDNKKKKKSDDTLEKLKNKPPEEIKKEIHKDNKNQALKYKTLSIIVSLILFLFLFGLAVAASYYKNATRPKDSDFVPKARIELPTEVPEEEDVDTSDWKIYENSTQGFQIKYPNYMVINETDEEVRFYSENEEPIGSNYLFEILVTDTLPGIPIEASPDSEDEVATGIVERKTGSLEGFEKAAAYSYSTLPEADSSWIIRKSIKLEINDNSYMIINFTNAFINEVESPDLIESKILSTLSIGSENVQGLSTSSIYCLDDNEDILSEVSQCEELTEGTCTEYVDQFDYCMGSCLNVLDEQECRDVCRPTCEEEINNEA